jgi:xanthine phosphoribosyltransferase
MKYYPYEQFKNDTNRLLEKVRGFEPQAIVAIARGGMTLSHALSEGLNLRNVQSIRTELYDNEEKREEITLFGSCELDNIQRVLVVDDIADSGDTLQAVMRYLEERFPHTLFHAVTLFYKKTSVYEPHYWINEANEWIEFFWERDFSSEPS